MKKANYIFLFSALLAACSSPNERAELLAKDYNRQYELFRFECREAVGTFATGFEEKVSIGRYESRRAALDSLDSLLHICQHDYTTRLSPILDEYEQLDRKRYRLLGEYRQRFEHTFDSIARYRADDSTALIDSIKQSPKIWSLLNSMKDPALPNKTAMAAQLVGTRVSCAGDPYFHDSSYVLEKGNVVIERIHLEKRHYNGETGNNHVPVEIAFRHGNLEFKGIVTINYELHDGDLDWKMRSVTSQQIAFQPNHAYDKYVQSRICDDGSWKQRLHLINRSNHSVMVGCWIKYEKRGNFFRQKKEYTLEHKLIKIPPAPDNKLVVDLGTLKPSAAEGGVDFVVGL